MEISLPHNLEAEYFLLSRMLNSINAVNEAVASLRPEDFYDLKHQVIFTAMVVCYKQDINVEVLNLYTAWKDLDKNAELAFITGLSIYDLGYSEPATHWIEKIKNTSKLRQMISVGRQLMMECGKDTNPNEVYALTTKKIELIFSSGDDSTQLSTAFATKDFMESGSTFVAYLKQKQEDYRRGIVTLAGIPTGYHLLDNRLSGLCRGHYVIIGARPGVGKSSFMIAIMNNLLRKDVPCGFFSLEMTADELMYKLICSRADLNSQKTLQGMATDEEIQRLEFVAQTLTETKAKLVIDDQSGLGVSQLCARAKRMIAVYGIKVLFIDYLGEVKGDGKFGNKQEEVQMVSKTLRQLAKATGVTVVCACQLNRENEKEERKPRKSDLRESGQIEADAHCIMLLHSPSENDENQNPGSLQVHIVKNRFGPTGMVPFVFKKETGAIHEIDLQREVRAANAFT